MLLAASNGKELWYLTRGTGVVALMLLTASVLLGIASSTRWSSARWPRFVVAGLHRGLPLLAIAFVAVHVLTTVVDHFAPIGLLDAVVPFHSPYRPLWLGLGTVAFDLLLAVVATSLLRARVGLRGWRAVHWLAYASWPVALVHSLGTGSDARVGWFQVIGAGSTVLVVLALVWRAWAARVAVPARVGVGLASVAVPLLVLAWADAGPLKRGWAARAGTPTRILAAPAAPTATAAAAPVGQPSPPSGAFSAPLRGTITDSTDSNGLVVVTIDASATGAFAGRIHVAVRGVPLDGGGVQMQDAVVGLLPSGATQWESGTVAGLDGQRILTVVRGPDGRSRRYLLDLQLHAARHEVSGTIRSDDGEGE